MKLKPILMALALTASYLPLTTTHAQGTAFTYQGRLNDGANAANGEYDLRFAAYDAAASGTQQGVSLTNSATAVSNGLFTVTLDFGNQFPGPDRWLEISVRSNGAASFFTLSPRQALTPAPYAITAARAATLAVGVNQPVNFSVNGTSVLRIDSVMDPYFGPTANFLGGYSGNVISNGVIGSFIGGGGNSAGPNRVGGNYASVLGGAYNIASGDYSTASGEFCHAVGYDSTALGYGAYAAGPNSTSLGDENLALGWDSVAMGGSTTADGSYGTAMGYQTYAGENSTALGNYTDASGTNATAMGYYSVASGRSSTAMGSSTTASGSSSTALGSSTIASGDSSTALGNSTTASGPQAMAAGSHDVASGINSVAMGEACVASALAATALGYHNTAGAPGSTALGVFSQALHNNTFVFSDGTPSPAFASTGDDQFLVYASGGVGINTANPLGDALCVSGDARLDAQPAAWNEGLAINCPTNMVANGGFGGIHFHSTGLGQGFSSSSIKWSEMYNYAPELGNAVGGGLAFIRNNSSTALYLSSSGNVGVGTTSPAYPLQVAGNCAATTFVNTSDRNAKENFQSVNAQDVLAKVVTLPVTRWNYKEDKSQAHVGPMAQDFYAAFAVGPDDKHITTVDEAGVALAAIQGLNQKLEETRAENIELKQELSDLKRQFTKFLDQKH